MIAEDLENESDDGAPIDAIEALCESREWSCERIDDEELVVSVQGSWAQFEVRAVWRDQDRVLQLLALPDIRVAADRRAAIYEVIGLINEQLWLGHFELWSTSGILVFRHAAMLDPAEPVLSLAAAEALVDAALDECDRFYPVFQFVLWGGKSPAEALAAAMIETHGEA